MLWPCARSGKKSDENVWTHHWDWGLGQPCHEFLNVSNPENLSERRPEGGVIPEVEVETVRGAERSVEQGVHSWPSRVIKSFPFFNGKELAEFGISESNSLEGLSVGEQAVNSKGNYLPHTRTSSAWHKRPLGPV